VARPLGVMSHDGHVIHRNNTVRFVKPVCIIVQGTRCPVVVENQWNSLSRARDRQDSKTFWRSLTENYPLFLLLPLMEVRLALSKRKEISGSESRRELSKHQATAEKQSI
jgi:hypothetical protein